MSRSYSILDPSSVIQLKPSIIEYTLVASTTVRDLTVYYSPLRRVSNFIQLYSQTDVTIDFRPTQEEYAGNWSVGYGSTVSEHLIFSQSDTFTVVVYSDPDLTEIAYQRKISNSRNKIYKLRINRRPRNSGGLEETGRYETSAVLETYSN